MAITIITKPADIHSGYNPVKYVISSTNRNKVGFRYVVQIFNKGTSVKLAELMIAPDSTNSNYGEIDVSRILQNKLDGHFITGPSLPNEDAVGSYYQYDIKFGESTQKEWEFNDYIFLPGGALGLTTDLAYGVFSNAPHGYAEGDQIRVTNNSNYSPNDTRRLLEGVHTVIRVVDTKTIEIGGGFNMIGSNTYSGGKSIKADNSKTITYNLLSSSHMVVNTAMNLKEFVVTGGDLIDYIPNDSTSKILTNQPLKYKATLDQEIYFNILNRVGFNDVLYFENSNGDILNKNLTYSRPVWSQSVGPGNYGTLSVKSGSLPLIKSDTEWYDVYLVNYVTNLPSSQKYRIYLDRRCAINDTQIMFMDRKGSYNSFSFQLKQKERFTVKRESYSQYISSYSTSSKGDTIYYSESEKSLDLKTNFMSEAMNLYYEELITSRNTYVFYKGDWYACVVKDTSVENEFGRNNRFIRKDVTVKFAVNDPIN